MKTNEQTRYRRAAQNGCLLMIYDRGIYNHHATKQSPEGHVSFRLRKPRNSQNEYEDGFTECTSFWDTQ